MKNSISEDQMTEIEAVRVVQADVQARHEERMGPPFTWLIVNIIFMLVLSNLAKLISGDDWLGSSLFLLEIPFALITLYWYKFRDENGGEDK